MHTHATPLNVIFFSDCKKILTSLPPYIWMYLTSIVLWMKGLICSYCWHGIVMITQIAWSTFCFCFIFGKFAKLKLWILYWRKHYQLIQFKKPRKNFTPLCFLDDWLTLLFMWACLLSNQWICQNYTTRYQPNCIDIYGADKSY